MGPHAVGFVFAIGVILSSPVLVLYFLNLPLRGPAISITAYFSGTASQHLAHRAQSRPRLMKPR